MKPKADYLFEVSWEVCNKVGGIYTVLESKAGRLVDCYGENYFLVGPYFSEKAKGEFKEEPAGAFEKTFKKLEEEGIRCRLGKWLVTGEPRAILIEFRDFLKNADRIKQELWEDHRIDSLYAEFDFVEPVVWSRAAGRLIEELSSALKKQKIVAHFHEWLSAAGLLYLKKRASGIGTVFSTHATILGRTLANAGEPLYEILGGVDPDAKARERGIQAKHRMEKSAALSADIFTTLSEINAIEAEKFLGRKPDLLLPNGLDISKFPAVDEALANHRIFRKRLTDFVFGYFFPYSAFDVKNTLFYVIAGRYEFRNKGIDIFIKALGRLNRKLRGENKNIVAFFLIPAAVKNIRPEVMESLENYRDIVDSLKDASLEMEEMFIYSLFTSENTGKNKPLSDEISAVMERKLLKFRKNGLPPLSTHELADPNDAIISGLRAEGLENKPEDKVKAVFCPFYLTGSDGLINLDYRETIQAAHFGIFPSYYEPWGYTPLETAALGVPALTTDLAGVGRFLNPFIREKGGLFPGIYILERFGKNDEEAVDSLFKILWDYQCLSAEERGENKIRAWELAGFADWKNLIKNYIAAHNKSLEK